MSDVFPVRNLPPGAEHWGRLVEGRLRNLSKITQITKQSAGGLGRYAVSSSADLANAAQGISELASEIESALIVFPRPYVKTNSTSGWAVGDDWTTVASASVDVPEDKDRITVSATADVFTLQAAGPAVAAFEWPFSLDFVTSEFGPRPPLPFHRGIDFSYGGITGDPIPAAASGTVILNQYYEDWGNYVRISHTALTGVPNTWTGYAHLQSPSPLPVGSTVTQGQIIGQVGTTGFSTGAHLHFETALENQRIDPRQFFSIYGGSSAPSPLLVEGRLIIDGVASRAFYPQQFTGFAQNVRSLAGATLIGKAGRTVRVEAQVRTGSDPTETNPSNIAMLTIKGDIE